MLALLLFDATGVVTRGTITNSTGLSPESFNVTGGGAYAINSEVVIKLNTDAGGSLSAYYSIRISNTLSGTTLTGQYELDSDIDGYVGDADLTFTAAP